MRRTKCLIAIIGFFVFSLGFSETKQIAITIDDYPLISDSMVHFNNIKDALIKHKAPATAFIIAERVNSQTIQQVTILKSDGFLIGSHTYSHRSLRRIPTDEYIEDIAKADKILAPFMTETKYFRYPYLAEGKWWWIKKKVHDYLKEQHYVIAPVTVDSRDFKFNLALAQLGENNEAIQALKKKYIEFVWAQTQKTKCPDKKQILLIHANVLNSLFLDDLLTMYESHGYQFISLPEAL